MTAGQLKKLLETVPDEVDLVIAGKDHSFCYATAVLGIATEESDGSLSECYGEPAVQILLVS